MRNFRELRVWQDSITITTNIYKITKEFPSSERFGLCSQMQRCAVSIASNIAEGSSRRTSANFAHYLEIAIGSAFELETQLTISKELNFIENRNYQKIIVDLDMLQKRLNSFRSAVLKQNNR